MVGSPQHHGSELAMPRSLVATAQWAVIKVRRQPCVSSHLIQNVSTPQDAASLPPEPPRRRRSGFAHFRRSRCFADRLGFRIISHGVEPPYRVFGEKAQLGNMQARWQDHLEDRYQHSYVSPLSHNYNRSDRTSDPENVSDISP